MNWIQRACLVLLWGSFLLPADRQVSLAAETTDSALTLSVPALSVPATGNWAAQTSESDLAYRRIFVPADDPDQWPVGSQRYLPMDRMKFEQRLRQAQADRRIPSSARLRSQTLILHAKLNKMDRSSLNSAAYGKGAPWQLTGAAEMKVSPVDMRPNILRLEPLNLAISSAHWTYSGDRKIFPRGKGVFPPGEARPMKPEEQSTENVPARWGLWKMGPGVESASPSKPRTGVLVDRPGTLRFQWQLIETRQNGSHASDQSVNFVLQTPVVVRKTMDLVLPAGAAVEVKPGIVSGDDPQGADFRVWHLELGAATEHRLNIRLQTGGHDTMWQAGLLALQAKMPRVRQSTEYQLSPAGLDLVTTIRLEDPISAAGSLQLRLAESTLVTRVTVDGHAVDWEIAGAEDSSRLQIPLEGGDQAVQVRAMLPIVMDESWQLPTIRPLDVYWVQGSTSLRIHPRLQLQSLVPIDCTIQQVQQVRQVWLASDRPHAWGAMEPATRYDLLESSQQATLRIVVGKQPIRLQLRAATTTSQRDNTVIGHTVAVIHNVGQPQYFVEAEIAPHWKLLSAETDPVDVLARWDVFGDGDRQVVRIGFASALVPGASVRIELDGRAMTDFATERREVATVDSLRMVRFRNVAARRQLLLLQSHPAGQLAGCKEAQDAQIAADSLTSDDQQLLPEGWQGVLLDLDRLAASAVIDLRPQRAIYTGDVHVELSVLTDGMEHYYWLECVPTSGAVTDVALQFSQVVPHAMSWNLQIDGSSEINHVATKQVQPRTAPRTMKDENRVRLVLPLALEGPFRLEARYSTPHQAAELAKARIVPNVISLPEALTSQTWVLFRSVREGLAASAGESTAVAFPAAISQVAGVVPSTGTTGQATGQATGDSPATGFPTNSKTGSLPVLGCYRLDSVRMSHGGEGASQEKGLPALVPTVSASQQTSSGKSRRTLFARFADFSTYCSADGTVLNVMVYHLENHGARQAEVILPAGTVLQSVWQDGRKHHAATVAGDSNPLLVSLGPPTSKRRGTHTTLALRYVSHRQPLGWLARMEPACPRVSFPVMQGRWTLWTAQPWTVRFTSGASTHGLAGWRPRLFGPLARWSREDFFNPLQSRSWHTLWTEPLPRSRALPRLNRLPADRPSADIISPVSSHFQETQVAADTTAPVRGIVEMPGWRAHAVEFVGRPVAVKLVRTETVQARWFLLGLLVTVVGAWQLARWPRFLVLVLALAAATCLFVEPDWVPAGSARGHAMEIPGGSWEGGNFLGNTCQAIFLGLLGSLILRGVWHGPARIRRGDPRDIPRAIVPMALVLWLGGHGHAVRCDADPGMHASARRTTIGSLAPRTLPRVLIPVNPQGEPSQEGEVYVPQSLYHQLFEPPRQTLATAQWVLTAAHYRGSLLKQRLSNHGARESATNRRQYVCGQWKLSFDVTSLQPHCQWRLPLRQGAGQWFEDEHRLDGEPLRVQWLPGDAGCRILLPQPGTHRLELALRPEVLRQPRSASLRVAVPAVAGATLDLQVPAELAGLKILHAANIEPSSSSQSIRALLPPVEAIEVRWTPAHRTVDARARWNAEQWMWLKVEPSRALLEMKLRISAGAGPLPMVQLDTDSQWELLPLDPGSPIDDLETFAGNPRTLQLKLRPEIRTPVEIPLRFQLDRETSIGRIAYPQLRLVNVATSRRVLAVSVAAGLSYQEQADSRWKVLSPVEFMARWGDGQTEPLFAYILPNQRSAHMGTPLGALEVRPDPQSFTAKQSLTLRCGLEKTALRYQAQIDSIAGPLFIHRLEVPADLRLETVHVRELTREGTRPEGTRPEETRQARWATAKNSRTGNREVTVFFSRPIHGPHELVLRGHFVQQPNVPTRIPRVVLKQADASPMQVEIFRAANAWVTGSWPRSPREQADEPPSAVNQDDVFVDDFLLSQHDPKVAQYTVTPNEPRFSTECLTVLEGQEDGWSVTYWVQVHALHGVVDRLRVEVPEAWLEPAVVGTRAQLRPLGPDASQGAASQGTIRYEIRFKHPLAQGERTRLRIIGRLELKTDQLARMPDIRLVGSSATVRYLALPRSVQGRTVEWRHRGLQQTDLPPELEQAARLEDTVQTFRVVQKGYLAEQRIDSPAADRVKVPLAQMHGALNLQGEWAGTALLVLHPGKAAQCQLQLPPQSRLLQLWVGGQPVPRVPVGDSGWRIGLGPPSMPRMIAVSYTAKLELQDGVARLRAPKLLFGVHVLRPASSYWEIRIAGNIEIIGSPMGQAVAGREIDALTFAQQGYEGCLQSLEEAGPLAFQLPHWDAEQWFAPWQSHLEYAFARWQQVGLSNEPVSLKGSPGWQALCDALGRHEEGVEKGANTNHAMALTPWEEPAGEDVSRIRQRPRYYACRSDGVLEIRLGPRGGYLTGRRLSAGLLVTFALLAIFLETRIRARVRQTALTQRLAQVVTRIDEPQGMLLTLLAAGLVWWLWLTPSVVGFVVVLGTSLALARRLWLTARAKGR